MGAGGELRHCRDRSNHPAPTVIGRTRSRVISGGKGQGRPDVIAGELWVGAEEFLLGTPFGQIIHDEGDPDARAANHGPAEAEVGVCGGRSLRERD